MINDIIELGTDDYQATVDGVTWFNITKGSRFYSTVLEAIANGAPVALAPSPVPQSISMRQAKIILHRYGLLETVNSMISEMPAPEGVEARIDWEYATTFERGNRWLAGFMPLLNLTDSQIDQMFIEAEKL